MQQSKYGTGGAIVRKKFRGYKPSRTCGQNVNCTDEELAYYSYGDGSGTDPYFWGEDYLDLMELEAEMEENAGKNSEYWFDAPEFN